MALTLFVIVGDSCSCVWFDPVTVTFTMCLQIKSILTIGAWDHSSHESFEPLPAMLCIITTVLLTDYKRRANTIIIIMCFLVKLP